MSVLWTVVGFFGTFLACWLGSFFLAALCWSFQYGTIEKGPEFPTAYCFVMGLTLTVIFYLAGWGLVL